VAPPSQSDPLASIDPVIHAPARLRLIAQLYVVDSADATFLVNATGLTWGNLATHLRKLEDHGYVTITKGYRGRKPHTAIALTNEGRDAFDNYRTTITAALRDLPNRRVRGC
jgi:DNA-binding transcriptional ArsR family regulator